MERDSIPPAVTARSQAGKGEAYSSRKIAVTVSVFAVIAALVVAVMYFYSQRGLRANTRGASQGVANLMVPSATPNPPCQPGKVSDKLVPSCGAWWGAYTNSDAYGGDYTNALAAFEKDAGRQMDIVHRYHAWNAVFPDASEKAAAQGGRIVYLSWQTQTDGEVGNVGVTWADIAAGKYDATIDKQAARIKEFQYKVLLDIDQEPDAREYAGKDVDFARAYRHIHDRFAQDGVTNVVWAWTVSGWEGVYFRYAALYPGDDYVDWIGFEPYNWYVCHGIDWQMPVEIFSPFYQWLQQNGHGNKPVIVSEYGTFENKAGNPQSKANWMLAIPAALRALPNIKAAVYFNQDYKGCEHPGVNSSVASIRGFAEAGSDPYLNQPHAAAASPATH